jgi:hypothetical protein
MPPPGTPLFSKIVAPTTLPARLPSSDFGGHRRDRRRRVASVDRRRLTGDRHALQLQDVLVECEIGGVRTGRDLDRQSLEADRARKHLHFARGRGQPVLTTLVGAHTLLCADDADRGFGDGGARSCLGHLPRDLAALLRRKRHGRCHEG